MSFLTYRTPQKKATRTTAKTVEAALARYAQRHNQTIGHNTGQLSLSIWGSDPTWYQVFDMISYGAGNPLCGPRCGKDMVIWLESH
jgi:hypothetical protein